MFSPHERGWGREFCAEYCKESCSAREAAVAQERPFDPAACSAKCPEVAPRNRTAFRVYDAAWWQFSSSGLGDATFPGRFAQVYLGDLGVSGPARVDALERIRVLDEQRRKTDLGDDGKSIRAKREKKPDE